jgi:hypothetical protein
MPWEYLERARGNLGLERESVSLTPERTLILAMVESAFRDLQLPPNKASHREAFRWVMSDDEDFLTFVYCCQQFGWDASWVRRGLLANMNTRPNLGRPRVHTVRGKARQIGGTR